MNLYEDNHYLLHTDKQLIAKLKEVMEQREIDSIDRLLEKATAKNIRSLNDLWDFVTGPDCDEELALCVKSLVHRIKRLHNERIEAFTSSAQLGYYLQDKFCGSEQEKVYALFLDSKNKVIAEKMICEGTLNRSIIHPRDIFRRAVIYNCCSFVLAHNHPSGDDNPSKQDIDFTNKVKQASKMMGIEFLDHFVVSDTDYFSFREAELL
ncbi:DNA repair protein RadC [Lactobacillus colini]|uniref:DNA repair protein RadC n=1 Tax=Lactobacillus colini TaxID=1819254 RepID=A0ABS4MDQ5_9LACO|nr:JAB domain-containing protein [Lactobacillus colini]MBP2057818.1 DNA repair protein RadC [Lactobacillus colini]